MHLKMDHYFGSACIALAAIMAAVPEPISAASEPNPIRQPNILFILSDDQSYDTIRALGNREVQTPNLDRLVRAGTTFTHAYNMGSWSGAVCVPSRTMLNTGRWLWPVQTLNKNLEQERQAGRFWSEQMRRAGYATYFTGKWHVNLDAAKAFDVAKQIRGGMPNQTPQGYHRPIDGQPDPWTPWDRQYGGFWEGGKHWSEVVGEVAEEFLETAARSDQPFFMYIAFNAPHDPRQSPKEYVEMYPLENIRLPVNYQPEYPFKDGIGCGKGLRDEQLAPFPRTEYAVKVHRREYYAVITHMDAQIGRILQALEKSGKGSHTYIFFTSDHGLAAGQHGLMGKQNLYDHSMRVPFIAAGPGVARGRQIGGPIYLQDVMPTTLELAGLPKPDHVQFHSLMPLLRGETDSSACGAIYGAYLELQRAVILDDHKLILYPKIPKARLYDLKNDPHETTDLGASTQSRALMKKLFNNLLELQRQNGDKLNLQAAFPDLL